MPSLLLLAAWFSCFLYQFALLRTKYSPFNLKFYPALVNIRADQRPTDRSHARRVRQIEGGLCCFCATFLRSAFFFVNVASMLELPSRAGWPLRPWAWWTLRSLPSCRAHCPLTQPLEIHALECAMRGAERVPWASADCEHHGGIRPSGVGAACGAMRGRRRGR